MRPLMSPHSHGLTPALRFRGPLHDLDWVGIGTGNNIPLAEQLQEGRAWIGLTDHFHDALHFGFCNDKHAQTTKARSAKFLPSAVRRSLSSAVRRV